MPNMLVIDDDTNFRMLIQRVFRTTGMQIQEASNAADGLSMARKSRPDVILMDVYMPGQINGWDATRSIKADPQLRNTPVVMISAGSSSMDQRRANEVGAEACFGKPFDVQSFREYIIKRFG